MEELPEIARRLQRAATEVAGAKARERDELALRNRLIVEACDAGYTWRDVARWAGVTMPRIQQIIVAQGTAA